MMVPRNRPGELAKAYGLQLLLATPEVHIGRQEARRDMTGLM